MGLLYELVIQSLSAIALCASAGQLKEEILIKCSLLTIDDPFDLFMQKFLSVCGSIKNVVSDFNKFLQQRQLFQWKKYILE